MAITSPLPALDEDDAVPHWTEIDWSPFLTDRVIAGRRVHFLDYGSGPVLVLVLLHGMAASWKWWLENLPTLGMHHRIIAVDLPGFGDSDPLPFPAEMSSHARTVLALMDALDIGQATVTGHSMGGLIALEIALAEPDRVRELVLVDAGGAPMSEQRLSVVLVVLRLFCAILRRGFVRDALIRHSWARRIVLVGGFRDPRVVTPELAAQIMPGFSAPGFLNAVAAAGRAVRAVVPESISCPTLLVWGDRDLVAPVRGAQDLYERLADAELVVLRGVGHTPMIECPSAFHKAVLAIYSRVMPKRRRQS